MRDNSVWNGDPRTAWFTILETYNTYYRMITDFLNDKQLQLLEFVKQQHGEQVRKYIGTPYWEHPLSVAKRVTAYEPTYGIEVALCHDLFEDTPCTFDQLFNKMIEIGYTREFSYDVGQYVKELTDVFTKENFPYLNRKKRKISEAKRLGQASSVAQTVKYADLIDNTSSIVEHDPNFAKTYLAEKKDLLDEMKSGNKELYAECCRTLERALNQIEV